jgi:hypothetical protein
MEKDSRVPRFLKNDLLAPLCGLFTGLLTILQSWLPRPQWQKDWLLLLGALLLAVDIIVLSLMVNKKNILIENMKNVKESSGSHKELRISD